MLLLEPRAIPAPARTDTEPRPPRRSGALATRVTPRPRRVAPGLDSDALGALSSADMPSRAQARAVLQRGCFNNDRTVRDGARQDTCIRRRTIPATSAHMRSRSLTHA